MSILHEEQEKLKESQDSMVKFHKSYLHEIEALKSKLSAQDKQIKSIQDLVVCRDKTISILNIDIESLHHDIYSNYLKAPPPITSQTLSTTNNNNNSSSVSTSVSVTSLSSTTGPPVSRSKLFMEENPLPEFPKHNSFKQIKSTSITFNNSRADNSLVTPYKHTNTTTSTSGPSTTSKLNLNINSNQQNSLLGNKKQTYLSKSTHSTKYPPSSPFRGL